MDARQRQNKLSATYSSAPNVQSGFGASGHVNQIHPTQVEDKANNTNNDKMAYLDMVQLTMRLHSRLMAVVKLEMERQSIPLNAVQALLLFHIGDGEITAGELTAREHYLGSNASYNLKKLADQGWVINQRSKTDKRSIKIRLSDEGKKVSQIVDGLFERHLQQMKLGKGGAAELSQDFPKLTDGLQDLDRLWRDQILYRL